MKESFVTEWLSDVTPFLKQAKEYNKTTKKNYPTVYFAQLKNGHWGITLPAACGIGHTAIDCPHFYSNRDYATAWAMKVEKVLALGEETYLKWCQKYGYLSSNSTRQRTGVDYVRYDALNTSSKPKYQVFIPTTTKGYQAIWRNEDDKNYYSLSAAVARRNRILEGLLDQKADVAGTLPEKRIKKYRRILTDGAFQEVFLMPPSFEQYEDKNVDSIFASLSMAYTYCDDEKLSSAFLYFRNVFDGIVEQDDFANNMAIIKKYLDTLDIPSFTNTFCSLATKIMEKNRKIVPVEKIITEENIVLLDSLNDLAKTWGAKVSY